MSRDYAPIFDKPAKIPRKFIKLSWVELIEWASAVSHREDDLQGGWFDLDPRIKVIAGDANNPITKKLDEFYGGYIKQLDKFCKGKTWATVYDNLTEWTEDYVKRNTADLLNLSIYYLVVSTWDNSDGPYKATKDGERDVIWNFMDEVALNVIYFSVYFKNYPELVPK